MSYNWCPGDRFNYHGEEYTVKSTDAEGYVYAKSRKDGKIACFPKVEMHGMKKL